MDDSLISHVILSACFVVLIEIILYFVRKARRKHAHKLLIQAKRETQEIAQLPLHNPHPQIQIAEDGRLVFANPAALNKFPSLEKDGIDHDILKGIDGPCSREILYNHLTYHQTITQTRINGGKAYVIYCYDITDRKRHEKEIIAAHAKAEKMRQLAEEAREARGDFLANMSHELRTPMNGIIGLSDILVEMELGAEEKNLIEAVNSSARNLLILLNDILDFSKIEAGELTIETIPFDIRKIVQQIESLQKPVASQKGLLLEGSVDEAVPQILEGDPSRLQQILNNLLSNALKFTEEGSVTLRVYGAENKKGMFDLSIAVQDTGIGIPKDKQAVIFQKFQQADSSTARKYGGTGLGLTITRNLAELMGGRILIESTEGEGTIFIVTMALPIGQLAPAANAANDRHGIVTININAKIMIVDDHPVNLLFLRQTLSKMGYDHIDEATNGKQALEYFEKNKYDLIIMDCQMPEMDGYQATQNIRARSSSDFDPIIIAATADAMKGAEEKCKAAGMNDYISKPIHREKLMDKLKRWIPHETESVSSGDYVPKNIDTNIKDASIDGFMDWNHLNAFTDGDSELESQAINIFLTNAKTDIAELHKSLKAKNYTEWDSCAHKLYGASANIGATALAKICDEGQSLSSTDEHKIHEIHKQILVEYKRIIDYLSARKCA